MRGPGENGGENQIGSRPSGALWWAALTARRETGGATGHIDYTSPHADTGKLSNDSFTYGGVTRAIDGLFVDRNGHFQIWVDSGNGSVLPNGSVLHVGQPVDRARQRYAAVVQDHVQRRQGADHADTQVREAEGAVLSFRVTLEEAQASTVSVRYRRWANAI